MLKINWIGVFINNFVPAGLGNDFSRYNKLSKYFETKQFDLIGILLIDKIFSLLTLLALSLFIGFDLLQSLMQYIDDNKISWFLQIFLVLLTISIVLILIFKSQVILLFRKSKVFLLEKKYLLKWQVVSIIVSFQIMLFALTLISYDCLFRAFEVVVNYFDLLKFVPVVFIGELLPISINSIGVRESVSVYLFTKIGISKEIVLAHTLLGRIIGIFLSLIGGFFYLAGNNKPK